MPVTVQAGPRKTFTADRPSIDDAWGYWVTDPPHLDVLLNAFNTVVGIGVYKTGFMTYYTHGFRQAGAVTIDPRGSTWPIG